LRLGSRVAPFSSQQLSGKRICDQEELTLLSVASLSPRRPTSFLTKISTVTPVLHFPKSTVSLASTCFFQRTRLNCFIPVGQATPSMLTIYLLPSQYSDCSSGRSAGGVHSSFPGSGKNSVRKLQTTRQASYAVGTGAYFPGTKRSVREGLNTLTSIYCRDKECACVFLQSPTFVNAVSLNFFPT